MQFGKEAAGFLGVAIKTAKKLLLALFLPLVLVACLWMPPNNANAVPASTDQTTQTQPTDQTKTTTDKNTDQTKSGDFCTHEAGNISWIVCSVSSWLAKSIDNLYNNVLSKFLVTKPLSTDTESPIYTVWSYMRNVANVVFIIFMLVVVYSQVTGLGINNYGIKKVLPRIIIAAILVNLSYLICTIAVDVSNILGASLSGLFVSIREAAAAKSGAVAVNFTFTDLLAGGAGAVGAGAGFIAAGGWTGLLALIVPVILSAALAVIAAIIILAARQGLIVLLVLISPLAFVAYLLPNTEKWFEKWRKMLMQMLIIFPAFSLLFGAAQLAGWAILQSATSAIAVILGLAVQVVPLIFSPFLMKMSGSLLGGIGNGVRKAFNGAEKSVKDWSAEQQRLKRAQMAAKGSERAGWRRFVTPAGIAGSLATGKRTREAELKAAETKEEANYNELAKNTRGRTRGQAVRAQRAYFANQKAEYDKNVTASEREYQWQAARTVGNRYSNKVKRGELQDTEANRQQFFGDELHISPNQVKTNEMAKAALELSQTGGYADLVSAAAVENAKTAYNQDFADLLAKGQERDPVRVDAILTKMSGVRGETGKMGSLASAIAVSQKAHVDERTAIEAYLKTLHNKDDPKFKALFNYDNPTALNYTDAAGNVVKTIDINQVDANGMYKADDPMVEIAIQRAVIAKDIPTINNLVRLVAPGERLHSYRQLLSQALMDAKIKDDALYLGPGNLAQIGEGSSAINPEKIMLEALQDKVNAKALSGQKPAALDIYNTLLGNVGAIKTALGLNTDAEAIAVRATIKKEITRTLKDFSKDDILRSATGKEVIDELIKLKDTLGITEVSDSDLGRD
ncbi:hypothetical protein FWF48_00025 [Candidatus Saccharibacteria bacterium]|nr:hypothetical protein [Candidatus Saccharibacteria bacterium]